MLEAVCEVLECLEERQFEFCFSPVIWGDKLASEGRRLE